MNHRSFRVALLSLAILALPAYASAQSDAGVEAAPEAPPTEAPHADDATATETTTTTTTVATPEDTTTSIEAVPPPPAEPPAAPEPQAPTTPTPSATGAPSAAPVTAVVANIPIRVTGIAHAAIYGGQGVESFNQATSVAPTSALNPVLLGSQADQPELTFQVQQSRFGLVIGEGTQFRGIVEIDFVHFDQSSPVAQAFPRIRIAQLEWHFDDHNRIFVGQGWDIFGNAIGPQLLSHSSNLVGTMFQAGNIGFMRQQIGWEGRFGDVAIALAAGMQGNNIGATYNNLEESATPTGSARVMYYLSPNSVIGISGIGTAERFTDAATHTDMRALALGGELFADVTFGILSLHAEAYIAQNLANTGALDLSQGSLVCRGAGAARTCAMHDVADAGGYVSARLNLGEWSVTAMYGFAGVLRPDQVTPGYVSANSAFNTALANGQTPTLGGTGTTNNTPGMVWNMSGHVGVWYSPMRGLSFVLEPYFFFTRFVMDTTQQNDPTTGMAMTGTSDADHFGAQIERFAGGGQFTTMFQF